jgi:mono/diheme cytochrome c family protein
LIVFLAACGARRPPDPVSIAEPGAREFQSYCAACHQYDGQGVGQAPPLDGSPWVTGPEDRLIRIVLHGVRGPMEVHGKIYDLEMPGFGAILSDEALASLLSFVRRRFGTPSEPITPAAVGRIRGAHGSRTDYWRVEELLGSR